MGDGGITVVVVVGGNGGAEGNVKLSRFFRQFRRSPKNGGTKERLKNHCPRHPAPKREQGTPSLNKNHLIDRGSILSGCYVRTYIRTYVLTYVGSVSLADNAQGWERTI